MQQYVFEWVIHILSSTAGQGVTAGPVPIGTPSDVAIWVALIMSGTSIVVAMLNKRSSNRHGAQIADLKKQLNAVKAQLRRERLTWHSWARQVITYLLSLPDGKTIADGMPPMPDSLKRRASFVKAREKGKGQRNGD
jgi:hypothetical protein